MKKKIALIVATPMTFYAFYRNHIEYLKKDYDVTLIANFEDKECDIEGVNFISVGLERKPKPFRDLFTLMELINIFKNESFDVIHSTTPKAGLLSQIAAKIAGVKIRVHTFTGQVWANKLGLKRWLYKKFDSLIAYFSSHLLADSHSQMKFLIEEKIPVKSKIKVLGCGSISGVNLCKFSPKNNYEIRDNLKISDEKIIFLYMGRLNLDKGIIDLITAFETVYSVYNQSLLLIVGADEDNLLPVIKGHSLYGQSIQYYGFTAKPEEFMSMADVLCLPSYREGFGSVIIEASACGTPSIGSNIYGLSDAIVDEQSGLLFKLRDINDLTEKMLTCIHNPSQLNSMSEYGLKRAREDFDANLSSSLLLAYYQNILSTTN